MNRGVLPTLCNMLVDSHCHLDCLDLTPYENDFARFMGEAKQQEIEHLLCISINLEAYPAMRELVKGYADVTVSVGVHPNETDCHEPDAEELVNLAAEANVVAIGETGLDYFRSEGDLEWQRDRFRTHILAAKRARKPLVVHTREAKEDTLRILDEENAGEVGGVLHCFTEDWDMASRALDLNFHISFSGIVTFKNAESIKDVASKVPQSRYLIETDSPYLAPVPHRGKANYPIYVRHVAEQIAELRGTSFGKVSDESAGNFYALFQGSSP